MQTIRGQFEVKAHPEAPYSEVDGVTISPIRFEKVFTGPLDATATVHMLGARTPKPKSAGYVALERVSGKLEGRAGTFVLQHSGTMDGERQSLSVTVVPESGTGELAGLSGSMAIDIVEGQHHYTFEYELK